MADPKPVLDTAAALHALAALLDGDDAPLSAEHRLGLSVLLAALAQRLDEAAEQLLGLSAA
jgi:hypothetical protein